MKIRIATAKEAFNRNILLLTNKLNIEPRKKLVMRSVWNIALYDSRDLDTKKIGSEEFGELWHVVLEKIKWSEKVTLENLI